MNIRPFLGGGVALLMAVALLPASTAFAQDDVTCIGEETRQTTEGFHSTVVHFCTRWQWRPPTSGSHEGTREPGGEHDPDGGKGGTPEIRGCDEIKQSLAEAKEELDLVAVQLDATESWLRDVQAREAVAKQAGYRASDTWSRAQDDLDFFFTAYEVANGLDDEIEVSPKNGVTIVRPRPNLRPDHSLAYGIELDVAMRQEAKAREARDKAATAYLEVAEELLTAQSTYANLIARQAALGQLIERLQGQLGGCKG